MTRSDEIDSATGTRATARTLAIVIAVFIAASPLIARLDPGSRVTSTGFVVLAGLLGAFPFAYLALRMTTHPEIDGTTLGIGLGAVFAGRILAFCLVGIAASPLLAVVVLLAGAAVLALPVLGLAVIAKDHNVGVLGACGALLFLLLVPLSRALRSLASERGRRIEPRTVFRAIGPLALTGALGIWVSPLMRRPASMQLPPEFVAQQSREQAMRSASGALYEIQQCAQRYAASHAGAFPDSLAGLWANEPRCHGTKIQTAQSQGIEIRYRAEHVGAGMEPRTFEAAARVDSVRDPSRSGMLTNESGMFVSLSGRSPSRRSQFWPDSATPLRATTPIVQLVAEDAACVDRTFWDAARSGYPLDPRKVEPTPTNSRCPWGPNLVILSGSVYETRYIPVDTVGAVARGFAVSARPRVYGVDGFRSYLFDYRNHEAAGSHATPANRAADRNDPPPQPCETDSLVPCRVRP